MIPRIRKIPAVFFSSKNVSKITPIIKNTGENIPITSNKVSNQKHISQIISFNFFKILSSLSFYKIPPSLYDLGEIFLRVS